MKLISINEIKNNNIIILNNLDKSLIKSKIIKKINNINNKKNTIILFLKEHKEKKIKFVKNHRIFSWSIFKNSMFLRYNSDLEAKKKLKFQKKKNY